MNAELLKASILKLAIEGKLVPQLDSETSVEQIGVEPEDTPYEIPSKWKWVKLDDLFELVRGITFPSGAKNQEESEGMVRCLTTGSVQKVHNATADVFVSASYVKKERQYLRTLDIVISSANSRELVGKSILWEELTKGVAFGGFLTVARVKHEALKARFAYYVFQALFCLRYFENLSTQTTNIANLSNSLLSKVLLPLPPVGEQDRIVSKIEELLPLVESYGRSYDRLQEINAELPNKLKASILQEAIQGKLVSQVDSEGSVEQIESVEENVPFNVPDTWKWVRLGSVVNVLSSKRVHKEDWRSEGIPFYRAREIVALSKYGEVDNELFVEEDFYKSLSADSLPAANDLMVSAVGTLGAVYVVKEDDRFYYKDASVLCFKNLGFIDPYFLKLVIDSPYFKHTIKEASSGTTVGTLTIKNAKNFRIPYPPLLEQQRIVSRVRELMTHADALAT